MDPLKSNQQQQRRRVMAVQQGRQSSTLRRNILVRLQTNHLCVRGVGYYYLHCILYISFPASPRLSHPLHVLADSECVPRLHRIFAPSPANTLLLPVHALFFLVELWGFLRSGTLFLVPVTAVPSLSRTHSPRAAGRAVGVPAAAVRACGHGVC